VAGLAAVAGWAHLFLDWMSLRRYIIGGMQCFQEETCGCLGIARWAQEKLECVPLRVDSPVEVEPDFLDFDVCLIHFPRVIAGVWDTHIVALPSF
jgi:hypothetical protein